MKRTMREILPNAVALLLGTGMMIGEVHAAPPTRQTPVVVSRAEKGVVRDDPCLLPPAVGGRTCTPNARDFGYFEGGWRKWPTQQRYDQNFPQAIGATPIVSQSSRPATSAAAGGSSFVAPAPVGNNGNNGSSDGFQLPELTPDSSYLTPVPVLDDNGGLMPGNVPSPAPSVAPAPIITTPQIQTQMSTPGLLSPVEPTAPLPDLSSPLDDSMPTIPSSPGSSLPGSSLPGGSSAPGSAGSALPGLDGEAEPPSIDADLPDLSRQERSNERSIITSVTEANADTFNRMAIRPYTPPAAPATPAAPTAVAANSGLATSGTTPTSSAPSGSADPFALVDLPSDSSNGAMVAAYQSAPGTPNVSPSGTTLDPEVAQTTFSEVADAKAADTKATSLVGDFDAPSEIGLDGFCPVTLLTTEQWVEGSKQWSVVHHGITYYLASAEQVQAFLDDPDKYVPVHDGHDPVTLLDSGKEARGTTDNCVVFEGKLYMFSSEASLNRFFDDADRYK
ncbi:MAG: hypothetical protein Q4D38_14630 [Planctomycetia bacterium]|nr:hypothetical protein [Planctomycetia bacterium]